MSKAIRCRSVCNISIRWSNAGSKPSTCRSHDRRAWVSCPGAPLAYGLLTGKYDRATVETGPKRAGGVPNQAGQDDTARPVDDKRLDGDNPFGDTLFTERNWQILDELKRVAAEINETPARVALSWVVGQPGVASTLMGVSRAEHVTDNVAALSLNLSAEHRAALDGVSGGNLPFLYGLFAPCRAQPGCLRRRRCPKLKRHPGAARPRRDLRVVGSNRQTPRLKLSGWQQVRLLYAGTGVVMRIGIIGAGWLT
ncbi:aldo/keto reductase [Sphingomonas sp. H160509]|uniref:aldo/keto reductase n=1 Tax=Sphingomonas sp. H160509 TaxID=2955313 RepID=UPI002097C142|nr:aldo/keto reductase [Sphingomonas sp. H160509]MDD1449911.1 aldo/keto reductase [Sphingomonas sp. H160509]